MKVHTATGLSTPKPQARREANARASGTAGRPHRLALECRLYTRFWPRCCSVCPTSPGVDARSPGQIGKLTEAQRARIRLRSTQAPPCTHGLHPRAAPRQPPAHLSDYESLGVSGYGPPPRLPPSHIGSAIFGRGVAWEWRRPLSFPFLLGTGPLRQLLPGLVPGLPQGAGVVRNKGPIQLLLPPPGSPQAGLGGRQGGDWQRQGQTQCEQRQRQAPGERRRDRDPERDTRPLGCASCLPGSPELRVGGRSNSQPGAAPKGAP